MTTMTWQSANCADSVSQQIWFIMHIMPSTPNSYESDRNNSTVFRFDGNAMQQLWDQKLYLFGLHNIIAFYWWRNAILITLSYKIVHLTGIIITVAFQSQLCTRKRPTGSWVASTVCRPSHRYDHLTVHYNHERTVCHNAQPGIYNNYNYAILS